MFWVSTVDYRHDRGVEMRQPVMINDGLSGRSLLDDSKAFFRRDAPESQAAR